MCVDINECSDDNGGCDHTCTNAVGSYNCGCNDGYELDTDEHTCIGIIWIMHAWILYYVDLDEYKLETHLCNQNCSNTFGSYQCSCYEVQYHLATTLKLYKYSAVRVTVSAATEIRCTAYMQFIDTC